VFSLVFLLPSSVTSAQTVVPAHPPIPDANGVYEVAASDLKKLDSSPEPEFPRELSVYELTDRVAIAVTVSPEGRVKKAKAISGKNDALRPMLSRAMSPSLPLMLEPDH
jgi:hypothetical protein